MKKNVKISNNIYKIKQTITIVLKTKSVVVSTSTGVQTKTRTSAAKEVDISANVWLPQAVSRCGSQEDFLSTQLEQDHCEQHNLTSHKCALLCYAMPP